MRTAQAMTAVSIDGEIVPGERATISVFDRGFLYGDGVFEVFRTWGGVPVDLDAHLDRLFASATWLALRSIDRGRLADSVARTIAAAHGDDHRVRVVLTRGAGPASARLGELGPGRSIVIVEPLPALREAVSLAIVDWPLPRRPGPGHKTLAYLDHLVARELAAAAGADEAVRLDADGHVAECATANLFVVCAPGEVVTPPLAGSLPGVTRAHVLALCADAGLAVREARLTPAQLACADELFVTSAVRGVVPVVRLDDRPRATGVTSRRVAELYARRLQALKEVYVPPSTPSPSTL